MINRRLVIGALAGLSIALPATAFAQAYPQKPITLIVPYAPGGATDIIGRVVAEEMSNSLGQRLVVENRAGAGGSVGAAAAARAQPDGYTLLLGALTSHSINMSLQAKPGFDLKKEFVPVGLAGNVGLALVVHPSVPAKTVPELITLIKAKPDDYSYASSGQGSPQHLSGELFNLKAGTKMPVVPYRGSGPAMTDMVAGQVKIMFDTIPAVLQHVKGGSLRAIATTGTEASTFMPETPTAISQGLAGFEVSSWFGLLAPTGTPQPVLDKLNAELNKALQSPKLKEALALQGVVPAPSTPAEAAARIDAEITKWGELIKSSGIKAE
ncbi:MFS transporter [Bosea sp. AAP35]|uniref:Bug family tripartite tricarboxylate transporter substrate binding protein n=1 Tax=Bosea sp. AAP35 TaxID=1523417 RepID=UPI0006B9165B|nr:tripartite tricarboxylate transporter substrate binding protein [Bosea sp. AAP35]KPF67116.1 MFS transporter [Bosea sp. AAP35]